MCVNDLAADSKRSVGAPAEKVVITPEMLKAGEEAFFREMISRDYLDCPPTPDGVAAVLSAIFSSMNAKMPEPMAKRT